MADGSGALEALDAALLPGLAQAVQLPELLLVGLHRRKVIVGAARSFEDVIAVVPVGIVAPPVEMHAGALSGITDPQRLGETPPVILRAAGFRQPLDRFGLLLYISTKHLANQSLALTHLPRTDAFGNLVNGLGQFHCNLLMHR